MTIHSSLTHRTSAITHNYDVFHGTLGERSGRVFSRPREVTAVYAAGVLLDSLSDPEDTGRLDFLSKRIIALARLTGKRPVVSFTTRQLPAPDDADKSFTTLRASRPFQAFIHIGDENVFACTVHPWCGVEAAVEQGEVIVEGLARQVDSTRDMTHASLETALRTWCDRVLPAVQNPKVIVEPRTNNEDHFVIFDNKKGVYWNTSASSYTSLLGAGVFTGREINRLNTEGNPTLGNPIDGRDEILGFDEAIRRAAEADHTGLRVIDCLDIGLESEDGPSGAMSDHDITDRSKSYPTEQDIEDWWVKTVPKDPHGCFAELHLAVRWAVDWERAASQVARHSTTLHTSHIPLVAYPTDQAIQDWWVKTVPKDPHGCCGEVHLAVRWAVDWERRLNSAPPTSTDLTEE